jgi:rubrerythrin
MKYVVDIKGEIEGDYEIIGKYEERPRGQWEQLTETDEMLNIWHCSNCKEDFCSEMAGHPLEWSYRYCPWCGADMREGGKDEKGNYQIRA